MYWDEASFLLGAGAGAVIASIFGWLLQRIRKAWVTSQARSRPQVVIQQTHETPQQVVGKSIRARFQWLLWSAVLVAFLGGVGFIIVRLAMP